ncbi:tyrosine--tRNA ligase [Candidatus Pacearchaeota archaeon]|nr:tyrosine--tRNA ligase [Candidatus Pacearchaeota archaeon]
MNIKDRLELIKRNTAEIIGEDSLMELLKGKRKPVVYIGTAPTGRPHVGYFLWGLKVADLLKAGFHVKILIADLHAALDNTPWSVLEKRCDYYEKVIPEMIKAIGVDVKDLEFVKGSEVQLSPEYMFDVLKMSSNVSVHDSKKAAAEVVKLGDNPKLSGLLYPLMQAIDEEYLKVDAQLGGTDQRKIMVLARENLPKIGYSRRIEIMTPLVPGLIGKKMSSSTEEGKVDLLDDEKIVMKKINKAHCVEGDPDNGIMAFLKNVIMVMKEDNGEKFVVERDEKYGGKLEYKDYKGIEKDFVKKELHPMDLKVAVAREINKLLGKFNRKKLLELSERAYD